MNDDTFAGAYAAFHPQIVRFLRGMLSGRGDAADLAQEVFLRLHASGDAAPEGERVRFWLFRVARNLALNELRREGVRERLRAFVRPFLSVDDPHERVERDEQQRRLAKEIARLRPDHRAALLLCEWEEMSYDEIAATLDVSVAKVKSDIFRARQALRAALLEGRSA
ncbi:MAG TPA: RNA polymerase sigma factor [Thermoanaerobaculia bacterium]|jgi:RNA polymerase sigma-70 factor (ECF subfamily)|nr:RNA polymerase sigma factor [Thermoanaerobaculia bacterium]